MSAPQKSSRWGSFLSQAVAGVEARLDNILAEEDGSKGSTTAATVSAASPAPPTPPVRSVTPSKSTNDRLQERLARAVASRNAASSARRSTEVTSTTSSPRPSSDISQPTPDAVAQIASPRPSLSTEEATIPSPVAPIEPSSIAPANTDDGHPPAVPSPRISLELESTKIETDTDSKRESISKDEAQPAEDNETTSALYKERVAHLEETLREVQAQHQEELHGHVERVDALQTKLQYLAREVSEHARTTANNAPTGSADKKLAEKNDQVAQLMLEGQKLASTEQKLRTIIKKLREQLVGNEKELNEQKVWRQKAEKELIDLRARIDGTRVLEKANEEAHGLLSQSKREMDRMKIEIETKDRSIADLKSQLQDESEKTKSLAAKAEGHQREAGQKRVKDLEDAVAALEVEKGLAADRAKLQVAEAREKTERASERARAIELELKGEVQILESKLEALRARAEEASSGAVGDAQVKLLRQIETLQTQYSVASENWQGMEASLEARVANLEKERDEALRRESEMRRKAREVVSCSFPKIIVMEIGD